MELRIGFQKSVAALVLLVTPVVFASSGGMEGGGADYHYNFPDRDFAWFAKPLQSVHYCIERDDRFGASEREVNAAISDAIHQWTDLISQGREGETWQDQAKLSLNFVKDACSSSTDLIFYFGVDNQQIETAKKNFDRPIGMAVQTERSADPYWTKGFIWLSSDNSIHEGHPNWGLAYELKAICLHELGHVFGSTHVEGTIMTANIAWLIDYPRILKENQNFPDPNLWLHVQQYYSKINEQIMLLPDYTYANSPGFLGNDSDFGDNYPPPTQAAPEVFKELTGRSPQGAIHARIFGDVSHYRFEVSDSGGVFDFDIQYISTSPDQNSNVAEDGGLCIFSDDLLNPDGTLKQRLSNCSHVRRSEYIATIQTQTNGKLLVNLQINFNFRMADGPFRINVLSDKGVQTIFRSSVYE